MLFLPALQLVWTLDRGTKLLGKQTGGEQYAALHESIIRLTGGTVVVQRKRGRLFFGHFIERGEADAERSDGAAT